jgi:sigma-B regulation protein RsbU (phosphoserine phosphatase)
LSLKELFIKANAILSQDLDLKAFVTAVGTQFFPSEKQLVLTRAGHLPLYRYDAVENRVETILTRGLGLGLDNKGKFQDMLEEKTMSYHTGDVFLFVSDGITEARDIKNNEFGEKRLKDLLLKLNSKTSGQIKDEIIKQVKEFTTAAEQHDDQTVVVVKAV